MKTLGLNIKLNNKALSLVKKVIAEKRLKKKILPHWLKRIVSTGLTYSVRIGSDSAKQPRWYSDISCNMEVS